MIINVNGNETGVVVNGVVATVTGNTFIANHVPLQLGNNSITATATDVTGTTTSVTRTVTAQAGNYLRITSNIESGTAPLEITLRIDGSFPINDSTVFYPDNPAVVPLDTANPDDYGYRITGEGMYEFTVEAVGPDGLTYRDTVTVVVFNRTQLENLLKGKWAGMKQKITSDDIQSAGSYFPVATRDRFQAIFNDPSMEIMSRLNEISSIEIYTIMDDTAQGGAIRQEDDGEYAYPINFVRDEDGIWRIYGF